MSLQVHLSGRKVNQTPLLSKGKDVVKRLIMLTIFTLLPACAELPSVSGSRQSRSFGINDSPTTVRSAHANSKKISGRHPMQRTIDRTFTEIGDVIGNGAMERLTIHVRGDSMTSAFTWSLTIKSLSGATLYFVKRNDAWLDGFFGQPGYEIGCSNYIACKKQYYFEDIPRTIFDSAKPTDPRESKNATMLSELRETATAFFIKHDVPPEDRESAISEMQRTLTKPGFRVLDVPYSPVQWDPPAIWVQRVRMFVPYRQE